MQCIVFINYVRTKTPCIFGNNRYNNISNCLRYITLFNSGKCNADYYFFTGIDFRLVARED